MLPDNEFLRKELVAPRYTFTSSGKLKVESKDEMRCRGFASLVTRGALSRRWQQPIDYPSSAWIV